MSTGRTRIILFMTWALLGLAAAIALIRALFLFGPGDVGAENAFDNLMTDFFHDAYGSAAGIAAGLAWLVSRRRKSAPATAVSS